MHIDYNVFHKSPFTLVTQYSGLEFPADFL